MREFWVNVYATSNGSCEYGVPHKTKSDAVKGSINWWGIRSKILVGRWRITLKEAPRDGR